MSGGMDYTESCVGEIIGILTIYLGKLFCIKNLYIKFIRATHFKYVQLTVCQMHTINLFKGKITTCHFLKTSEIAVKTDE